MRHLTARSPFHHESLTVFKRGGVLTALDLGGYETRNASVLRLVADADRAGPLPDFAPLWLNTGDQPRNPGDPSWRLLSFSTTAGHGDVAVPDFLFDGWPQVGLGDYEDARAAAREAGAAPAERPVVGWIGNCDTHPSRWEVHRIAAGHPDLFDVRHVTWVPTDDGAGTLTTAERNDLTLVEQVRLWGALIDVEGRGWSARLKLLLHSGRPVLVQERPWREFFFDELVAFEHVIPVRRDLADLVEKARWVRDHPVEAARIGAAGQAFAQARLTRAAAVREWGETLRRLAAEPPLPGPPEGRAEAEAVLRAAGA